MRVAALLLASALAALAGGGPQNVLVLVNDTSPDSDEVARYYVSKRRIPARNVVRLRCPTDATVDFATCQATIERPLRRALRERRIAGQIDFLVLCQGMPLRVEVGGEAGGVLSLCAEIALLDTPIAADPQEQFPSRANPYLGGEAFRHVEERGGWRLYLPCHLAALSVQDVKRMIDSSVASDGTAPAGDFWFQDADGNASGRNPEYDGAIASLKALGLRADRAKSGAEACVGKRDVMGYMSGGCYSQLTRDGIHGNAYRPGSIVDMLESFGAAPQNFDPNSGPSQFPVTWFLDCGVAGIHGAVAEPYAHTFPSAKLFERYAEGYNLAETFYGTLPFVHWMNLVDGDPLCAPYAVRPEVKAEIAAPVGAGCATVRVTATPRRKDAVVARVELFVDGLPVATAESAQADLAWDTTRFANGAHELLVAATEGGPVATQGHAFLTATVDNPALRVVATVPPDGATNVPLAGPFEVRLNRPVSRAEGIALADDAGNAVQAGLAVSGDGLSVAIEPSAPLAGGRRYRGSVAAGWHPSKGEPLAETVSWSFTTAAKSLSIEAATQVQAGEPFEVKVSPRDEGGKAMTPYPGIVSLSSTDARAPVLKVGAAFAGKDTLAVPCVLRTLGRTTITAVDPESGARGEVSVEVLPGPVRKLAILPPPGGVARGTPTPIAVAAVDGADNPVPTFTGKVELSSEGNAVPLPPPHEFADFERGRHTFPRVVFPTVGEFSITAKVASGVTGSVKVGVADSGIRSWTWGGPFASSRGVPSIDWEGISPEAKLEPWPGFAAKGKRFAPLLSGCDRFDLTAEAAGEAGVLYAAVYVDSPSDREAQLWFGSENAACVFWDGAPIHKVEKKRNHAEFEDHVAGVRVGKGIHALLVKLLCEGAGVRFSAKLCDGAGKPIGEVTYGLAPPGAPARATIAGCVRVKGRPVPGVRVALSGPERLEATTGSDGRFEFHGLPHGSFSIRPSLPKARLAPDVWKVGLGADDVLDVAFELSDAVPPSAKLLSPKPGARVAGMTPLSAEASDNVAVRSVRFLVDDEAVAAPVARAPYQATMDASSLAPGAHALVVEVEDLAGNLVATEPQAIAVVVDTTAPVAQIASPKAGQRVKEKLDLAARVGDDVAVACVQWYVDDKAVGVPITAAPWSVPWTPDRGSKGKHVVKVVVKDTSGNAGEAQVMIEVK